MKRIWKPAELMCDRTRRLRLAGIIPAGATAAAVCRHGPGIKSVWWTAAYNVHMTVSGFFRLPPGSDPRIWRFSRPIHTGSCDSRVESMTRGIGALLAAIASVRCEGERLFDDVGSLSAAQADVLQAIGDVVRGHSTLRAMHDSGHSIARLDGGYPREFGGWDIDDARAGVERSLRAQASTLAKSWPYAFADVPGAPKYDIKDGAEQLRRSLRFLISLYVQGELVAAGESRMDAMRMVFDGADRFAAALTGKLPMEETKNEL